MPRKAKAATDETVDVKRTVYIPGSLYNWLISQAKREVRDVNGQLVVELTKAKHLTDQTPSQS